MIGPILAAVILVCVCAYILFLTVGKLKLDKEEAALKTKGKGYRDSSKPDKESDDDPLAAYFDALGTPVKKEHKEQKVERTGTWRRLVMDSAPVPGKDQSVKFEYSLDGKTWEKFNGTTKPNLSVDETIESIQSFLRIALKKKLKEEELYKKTGSVSITLDDLKEKPKKVEPKKDEPKDEDVKTNS